MKLEQLNFVSFVKLLKMLILASQMVAFEDTKKQFEELMKNISEFESFIPSLVTTEYRELEEKINTFFQDYNNVTLKNDIISRIDLILSKFAE